MEHKTYKLRGVPDCPISVYNPPIKPFSGLHPEVELILNETGVLHCKLEQQDILLKEGEILIVNPNHFHAILDRDVTRKYGNVIFSLDAITMPNSHLFQRNFVIPLSEGRLLLPSVLHTEHPAYKTVLTAMQELRQGNPHTDEVKLQRYIHIIAICGALLPYCVTAQEMEQRHSPEDQTARQVMTHIHFYYHKPLTLQQLADYVHLHPNYLCHLFKAYTGHTVMEHLYQTRVEAAKFLLRRDSLPMPRIAELCGFPSERAFYRQFRKVTGTTPKSYQKQHIMSEAEYL
ncbi:MAG: helix-turn-helix transcriptional regulator [Oscillospiraceae bacterium]|nr:helix-turn-helix transcriptional regulator [Oscillospiraceae bacterium]